MYIEAINKAIDIANKSPMECQYGAILVRRGKIVGMGFNKPIRKGLGQNKDTAFERFKYTIHAEVACLINCKKKNYLKDSTMILVRLKNGLRTKCESCVSCKKFIEKYNIRKVVYSY